MAETSSMHTPDFSVTGPDRLADRDLRLILETFPGPAKDYADIAEVIETLPNTLASAISSDWLFERIFANRHELLQISPFLLFCVLLHRCWPDVPRGEERKVVFYIANLLGLFARTDRLYRVRPSDTEAQAYISDLIQEALKSDSNRQFLIHSHIGNYALFLTGMFPRWIEHRHHFKRRPLSVKDYTDFGSGYYQQASSHSLAKEYKLDGVFLRLAMLFDHYRGILNRLSGEFLPAQTG